MVVIYEYEVIIQNSASYRDKLCQGEIFDNDARGHLWFRIKCL